MPDTPPTSRTFSQEQLDVFRLLYPLFKEEVFRRRNHMIRLTAWSTTLMLFLLIFLLGVTPAQISGSPIRWFAMTGVAVSAGLFAYVILQQASRHRMAKQQLIVFEREMGLYQEDRLLGGSTAYPEHWQTDWRTDRSVMLYLVVLASLTALVLCTIFILP